MTRKPYHITLSEDDVDTIAWVGDRYGWSTALASLSAGVNELAEHEAWSIAENFDEDTEGGHRMFPLLATDSDLHAELTRFRDSIV